MKAQLLISDAKGRVFEHPYLLATVRSGEELMPAHGRPIPLPAAGKLVHLPGRLPVGVGPETGEMMPVPGYHAVGALLPPGYTSTLLPGEVKGDGPVLPQWAYTAAAGGIELAVVRRSGTKRGLFRERGVALELFVAGGKEERGPESQMRENGSAQGGVLLDHVNEQLQRELEVGQETFAEVKAELIDGLDITLSGVLTP